MLLAQSAQNQLAGVGILIEPQNDGAVLIKTVVAGGPADRAGIKADDELLSVNGRSTADIDPNQLVNLVRGAAGSEVTLTIRTRGQRPRQVTMKRAPLPAQPEQPKPPGPAQTPRGAATPGASTAATGKAGDGVMKFTRVSVRDPGMNNVEAVSFLVPAGWTTEGGVKWFPDYSILANLLMKITDPQTRAQIEFLPLQNFTWLSQMVIPMQPGTNYLGNILLQPITDIPAFIRAFYTPQALKQLQNAKQISVEDLPRIASEAAKQQAGGSARSARVRYEYMVNGQSWEEDVFVTLTFYPWQLGTIWSTSSAYAFRAPKGQLDRLRPAMTTTITTLRLSQDWFGGYMYTQKLFTDRVNQGIANARALSDTISRNSEEIRRMYAESYRQTSESQDRISQSFSEYIRGVETYRNPFEGRPVQLPSGYNDAWVNSRGEYILSNNANFNPNVGDNIEWRRMDPRQR
jgi:hypothetical protein